MGETFTKQFDVAKVDEGLGIVFGWGEIFSEGGVEYFDTQGDARLEKAAVEAWADFLGDGGVLGDMHSKVDDGGQVLFAFPLTSDVAKALDIQSPTLGIMVGVKPSPAMLQKFISGDYTGFSIGGERVDEEVVEA